MTERPTTDAAASERREELCGRTLGDYRIERRVGGGATSDVFLATQLSLGRPVALKILKDELARDETYLRRFVQEARATARLEHPNIVRVYEVGVATLDGKTRRDFDVESLGGDAADGSNVGAKTKKKRLFGRRRGATEKTYRFIAQEYVDGMSLQRFLRRGARASIAQTFSALEQIAAALKRAADAGVVHRDVKPENILLDANGTIKVVDFGLARLDGAVGATSATLTRTGVAMGTPLYMSPEQARGEKIDSRSDIYSLGIVAYRMLTGTAPFSGDAPLAVILKHLNERPRPIEESRPDAPPALVALIRRMIEKKPSDRPESPDVLLDALRAARREFERSEENGASTQTAFEFAPFDASPAQGEREPENGVAATGFFQSADERAAFERALETTNLSQVWQTNGAKLRTLRAESEKRWTRRGVALTGAALVGAFLCGAAATAAKNRWIAAQTTEPPSTIRRFDSVEEQWVFALHTGTVDAWRSVGEYFPNDAYWSSRAERQLALAYLDEKNVAEAKTIFERIAANPSAGRDAEPFGLAGLAWCAALDGDVNAAVATISELRTAKTSGYDRLTEFALAKTEEVVRQQTEVALPRQFDVGGRGGPNGRPGNGGGQPGPNWNGPNGRSGNGGGQPGPGFGGSDGKQGRGGQPGPGFGGSDGKQGRGGQPGPGFGGSDGKQGRGGQPGPGLGGSDGKQGRGGQPGPGWNVPTGKPGDGDQPGPGFGDPTGKPGDGDQPGPGFGDPTGKPGDGDQPGLGFGGSDGKQGRGGQPGPGFGDPTGKPGNGDQPGPGFGDPTGKPGDGGKPKPDFGWSEEDAAAWSRFSFEDAWSRWNERSAFEAFWSETLDDEMSSTAPKSSETLVKAEEVGTGGETTDVGATEPCVASTCDSVCVEPCVASACDSVCGEPCVASTCDSACAEPCVASTCDSVCGEACDSCDSCGDAKRRAACESSS